MYHQLVMHAKQLRLAHQCAVLCTDANHDTWSDQAVQAQNLPHPIHFLPWYAGMLLLCHYMLPAQKHCRL